MRIYSDLSILMIVDILSADGDVLTPSPLTVSKENPPQAPAP
jgi:hypothetical protein